MTRSDIGPAARRRRAVAGIGMLILVTLALGVFLRSTPDAFPFADGAVIEIYTLQALRGSVKLGPYSQFGWHHPGPVYFDLLAPFYELAGHRAIGLTAGAIAINLVALATMFRVSARSAGRLSAAIVVAGLSLYLWRVEELLPSIWNPHIVVLALAALVVLCAALATGHGAALPMAIAAGSFLAQTHISLVPCSVLLIVAAGAASWHRSGVDRRGLKFWVTVSVVLAVALWLPPIVEQARGDPGNVTRIWRFFAGERHAAGQSPATAFHVWADITTAVVRRDFQLGWGAAYLVRTSSAISVLAVGQLLSLVVAGWLARRAGHQFLALLCTFCGVTSVVAGYSITQIRDVDIGDYQVFWMSIIGALSCSGVAAVALALATDRHERVRGLLTVCLSSVAVISLAVLSGRGLLRAKAYAVEQRDTEVTRKIVSLEVERYIDRERIRRPLFRISQGVWTDAACVVLQVYKRHRRLAVEEPWVSVFGEMLSPTGREDAEFQIADRAVHATLSDRPGDVVVAAHDQLFVHLLRRR